MLHPALFRFGLGLRRLLLSQAFAGGGFFQLRQEILHEQHARGSANLVGSAYLPRIPHLAHLSGSERARVLSAPT